MSSDFKKGLQAGAHIVPTFVAIFIGVGIAAQVANIPFFAALLSTLLVFAAPAQFAMFDVAMQGGVWLQVATIGVLVNLRFFVMSLTLSTMFSHVPRPRMVLWAQLLSASSYLVTFFESRKGETGDLFVFYRGVVLMTFTAAVVGTVVGLWFGAGLPPIFAFGASLFLPIYFALLLISEVRQHPEIAAALIGLVATPPLELLIPGWGLFIAALAGGTAVTVLEK